MADVKIFWNPDGFELDQLGSKSLAGDPADGDTPYIKTAIRLLSIDTPETNYPGPPSRSDVDMVQLAEWLAAGKVPIDPGLAAYLLPKLQTGTAGTLQEQLGNQAKAFFKNLLEERLELPNGRRRNVFVRVSNQPFDDYGRLLAYLSPNLTRAELEQLPPDAPERYTFNLDMVRAGWAAPFVLYPSLPKLSDLRLFHGLAQAAFDSRVGAWSAEHYLTGYEWRMCVKLFQAGQKRERGEIPAVRQSDWIERYCLDMTTLVIYEPQHYYRVPPYNRIFVWPQDIRQAVADLNLTGG